MLPQKNPFLPACASMFPALLLFSAVNSSAAAPVTTGQVPQLVILANYPGKTTTYTKADFEKFCSQPGYSEHGAHGSVRDWFAEVSEGAFDPQFHVTAWITLPRASSYYAEFNNWDDMGREAVLALDASGFDFAPFDANNDGFIDLPPLIIHQGPGREDIILDKTLFSSHEASFPEQTIDGVKISSYATVPEVFGTLITRLGVVIHELGHNLGLPEMYDSSTLVSEMIFGLGDWTAMAYWSRDAASLYPMHYGAWERIYLGWATPIVLRTASTLLRVDTQSIYKIPVNGSVTEYYLVENRQQVGFDRELPGSGLLVYHVDETKWDGIAHNGSPSNSDENHRHVDIIQADGLRNLNNKRFLNGSNGFSQNPNATLGDAGDPFPGTSNRQSLSPTTTPQLTSYANLVPDFSLSNIRITDSIGFFDIAFTRSYPAWKAGIAWGGTPELQREGNQDPDGDGMANALEMAFGTSPTANDSLRFPKQQVVRNGDGSYAVSLSYPRVDGTDTIIMEHSTDLVTWENTGVSAEAFDSSTGRYKQSRTAPRTEARGFTRLRVKIGSEP